FLLVEASGNGTNNTVHHWETAIYDSSVFSYFTPFAPVSPSWNQPGYDISSWPAGKGGFGYGDGDDSTLIPEGTLSVYLIDTFSITDQDKIGAAILHMDYDDGFVAYLNGTEIARSGLSGNPPAWDELAADHEALMYQGQIPSAFQVDSQLLAGALFNGVNVLAIELHNTSPGSSDLTARPFLSFGIADTSNFFGPIPAFFSLSANDALQTNFKISSEGETIYLSDATGAIKDSLLIDNLQLDQSVGKFQDGNNPQVFFQTATPAASNNLSIPFTGYENTPEINPAPGFYEDPVTITISSLSPGAVIRYTTNGNEPDTNSLIYSSPLVITTSQTIKAKCFSINLLPSATATGSYFINEEFTLPVISITTDSENLYGTEGIYDNWWTDWIKPCYVEYFDQGQQLVFAQRSSIKIDGGAGGSRSQPQKSFRLDADHDVLGDGAFPYALIPGRPNRDEYESVYLRNGSNQYLGLIYKDALATRLFQDTKTNYQEYRPVVAFLNGEYFGVYELREKQDEGYFKQNFQADPDALDILSLSYWYNSELRTLSGSADDFYTMHDAIVNGDPGDQNYYAQSDSLLDLTSYADYIIAETWIGNYDWPSNNIKIWRSHATDNKWHFGLIDLELALPPNGWSNVWDDLIGFTLYYDPNNLFVSPFQKLVQNQQFHDYFINRYADIMNSELLKDSVQPVAQQMYNELFPELPKHFLKWGDLVNNTVQQYMTNFSSYQADYMEALSKRSRYVRDHIVSNFGLIDTVTIELQVFPQQAGRILISTITPVSYPWKGIYFNGVPVTVTALPNPGYLFNNWSANSFIQDVNQQTTTADV
ncbi:MAG TPA: CotH kinase family protein, partial [Chitinophagales bacterium]|nr:CotH kinase family protein [Chitinophagales bacterium]